MGHFSLLLAKSGVNMMTCVFGRTARLPSLSRVPAGPTNLSKIGNGWFLRIASSGLRLGFACIATAMSPMLMAGESRKGCMSSE